MGQVSAGQKIAGVLLAVITWATLIMQFYFKVDSTANFLSYFTIQSNLLIALCVTFSALIPNSSLGVFFSKLSVQSAIALYIFIVFIVYNTMLRGIATLTGWNILLNDLLHVVIPILFIIYWLVFRTRGTLHWRDGLYWIFFPLLYLIYTLIRGAMVNWYPYPFLNAAKLGYPIALRNISVVIVIFLIAGLLLIAITVV